MLVVGVYWTLDKTKRFQVLVICCKCFSPPIIWEMLYSQLTYCKFKKNQAEEKQTNDNQKDNSSNLLPIHCRL